MAGRRLVDAAKLFKASKSIAAKHINLRSQQLDLYTKTSTLAKAVTNQTDRVTLTAQAAIALARRVNEDALRTPPEAASRSAESHDHERRGESTAAERPAEDELPIRQKEAANQPLPDGTIPSAGAKLEDVSGTKVSLDKQALRGGAQKDDGSSKQAYADPSKIPTTSRTSHLSTDEARKLQRRFEAQIPSSEEIIEPSPKNEQAEHLAEGHDRDVFYLRSNESQPELSSLPRTKIPKHTEHRQESVDHVKDEDMNQDVYYATPEPLQEERKREEIPHAVAIPEQDQVPEGVNTDVFRTQRVARMLGGNPYAQEPRPDLRGASKALREHTKLSEGRDHDTFNVRISEQSKPSAPDSFQTRTQSATEQEMHDFAFELAKDAQAAPSPVSEVRYRLIQHCLSVLMR
jgi:aarF domain-containing kinase